MFKNIVILFIDNEVKPRYHIFIIFNIFNIQDVNYLCLQ